MYGVSRKLVIVVSRIERVYNASYVGIEVAVAHAGDEAPVREIGDEI